MSQLVTLNVFERRMSGIEEKLDMVIAGNTKRDLEIENRVTKVEKDVSVGKWVVSTLSAALLAVIGYKAN